MANYRNIHMSFWTDAKVVDDFTTEDRYMYLWCLTNPHTNLCGCYEVSIKQMANETGHSPEMAEHILKRLEEAHQVLKYDKVTKELLLMNWSRHNWSASEKLNKPLLETIQKVKSDEFRLYLAGCYNDRNGVVQVDIPTAQPPKEKPAVVRHQRGEHGYVTLSDAEFARLQKDIGDQELSRCIAYIDESAKISGNKNKWKDWNMVIRKCNREGWGMGRQPRAQVPSKSEAALGNLQALHKQYAEEGA